MRPKQPASFIDRVDPQLKRYVRAAADGVCSYCGVRAWRSGTIDHYVPRSRGGTDAVGR